MELEAELRAAEEFAECQAAKAAEAAAVSADDLRREEAVFAADNEAFAMAGQLAELEHLGSVQMQEDNFDEATVAPLLRWLTSHSAAWAMGRMATAVVSSEKSRAARTSSCELQDEPTEGESAARRQPRRRPPRASCRAATTPTEGEPTVGEDGRLMRRAHRGRGWPLTLRQADSGRQRR